MPPVSPNFAPKFINNPKTDAKKTESSDSIQFSDGAVTVKEIIDNKDHKYDAFFGVTAEARLSKIEELAKQSVSGITTQKALRKYVEERPLEIRMPAPGFGIDTFDYEFFVGSFSSSARTADETRRATDFSKRGVFSRFLLIHLP